MEKCDEVLHADNDHSSFSSIGSLLGGTTVVETIFMWDGVGKMAVDAITMRDYPVVQAYVAWMAVIYVLINLVTDVDLPLSGPSCKTGR